MSRQGILAFVAVAAFAAPLGFLVVACVDDTTAPVPGIFGFVGALQGFLGADGGVNPGSDVSASYYVSPPGTDPCHSRVAGPCTIVTCPPVSPHGVGEVSTHVTKNAGVITVSGGLQPVTLVPLDGGDYTSFYNEGPLWNGGETLTFQALGGEIPGFTVTTAAPAQVTVLEPSFLPGAWADNGSAIYVAPGSDSAPDGPAPCSTWLGSTVSRSSDLALRWSGGTPSTQLTVVIGDGYFPGSCTIVSTASTRVVCTFEAGAGGGVVPANVLGELPAGVASVIVSAGSTHVVDSPGSSTVIFTSTIVVDSTGATWNRVAGGPFVLLQ